MPRVSSLALRAGICRTIRNSDSAAAAGPSGHKVVLMILAAWAFFTSLPLSPLAWSHDLGNRWFPASFVILQVRESDGSSNQAAERDKQ
jgi:hypothetical protein